jgi:hypothetical protein
VSEADDPSPRLVEQRLRNRAIEALETLSEGDAGVLSVGHVEYFEQFFDVINDDDPWQWRRWTTFTSQEVEALQAVHDELLAASSATPRIMDDSDFVATGWPRKIALIAAPSLELMSRRGRFSEDVEQHEPRTG